MMKQNTTENAKMVKHQFSQLQVMACSFFDSMLSASSLTAADI